MLKFLYITLLSITPIWLFAQKKTDILRQRDVLKLENIREIASKESLKVVSGSRSSQNPEDLPFTIEVITNEEIIRNGYVTLTDVLKRVSGIKVSQPGSAEEGETFLMRGLKGNQYTKILVNDIPIQPSTLGGIPIAAQLPIRQAKRIEIIFGPASSIYGADAVTGVINIITKGPKDGTFAQADAEIGQFGHNYLNFIVGGKTGRSNNILEYSFYGSNRSINDLNVVYDDKFLYHPLSFFQMIAPDTSYNLNGNLYKPVEINNDVLQNEGIDIEEFKRNNFQPLYRGETSRPLFSNLPQSSRQLGINLKYKGWKFSLSDMHRKMHSSIALTPFIYSMGYPQTFLGENIRRGTISYEKLWKNSSSVTNISYLQLRQDNGSSNSVNYPNIENTGNAYIYQASDDIFLEQYFTLRPTEKVEIVTGLTYQYSGNLPKTNELAFPFDPDTYKAFSVEKKEPDPIFGNFGYNPLRFSNFSGYAQLIYTTNKLHLMLGLRGDRHSLYGINANPRLGFLYKLKANTKIYASLGTSYRTPPSNLAYSSLAVPFDNGPQGVRLNYPITPNPNMNPESFAAAEIGIRHKFSPNWQMNISIFANQIEDLIVPVIRPLDTSRFPNSLPDITRSYANSNLAQSTLVGLEMAFKGIDLIADYRLSTDINFSIYEGREVLPDGETRISLLREMPRVMGQIDVSFYPTQKVYVNFTSTLASKWLRSYIPNDSALDNPLYKIDGYYNLDFLGRYYISKNISSFLRVINVFNTEYGGIAATGLDADLRYNPQLLRNIQLGVTFNLQ